MVKTHEPGLWPSPEASPLSMAIAAPGPFTYLLSVPRQAWAWELAVPSP